MSTAPGWIIGIGFLATALASGCRRRWRVALLNMALSGIAFTILYNGGTFGILLETLSLSVIVISGVCLLTKRGQVTMEQKFGLAGGTRELGVFLIILAIAGATGVVMSAVGW